MRIGKLGRLDDEGRMALVSALHHARSQHITTLIITHHKLLLRHVDKILLLRDGKMEAFGPAAQVIASLSGNTVQPLSKNSAGG